MIAVDFHNQAAHAERIAADLVGQHPSCWNVVLPPGFGEERFVEQLARCLRNRTESSRLAVRGADQSNKNITSFVQALHAQWTELYMNVGSMGRCGRFWKRCVCTNCSRMTGFYKPTQA